MIELKGITKTYNNGNVEIHALSDVSFKIKKGEYVSIIGPSGSGKSTLMHIIGALDVPTSGEYILASRNIASMKDDELAEIRNKEIGFVFQAYNLLARNSALKNVELPMAYAEIAKPKRRKRAIEVLESVGLHDRINNSPNQLSGGQKQRVAIARALSMEPSIILADEPTGNLPTKQGQEVMNIFDDLNEKGHTIVIITHEDAIANRTKRIIKLVDGKVVNDKNLGKEKSEEKVNKRRETK